MVDAFSFNRDILAFILFNMKRKKGGEIEMNFPNGKPCCARHHLTHDLADLLEKHEALYRGDRMIKEAIGMLVVVGGAIGAETPKMYLALAKFMNDFVRPGNPGEELLKKALSQDQLDEAMKNLPDDSTVN